MYSCAGRKSVYRRPFTISIQRAIIVPHPARSASHTDAAPNRHPYFLQTQKKKREQVANSSLSCGWLACCLSSLRVLSTAHLPCPTSSYLLRGPPHPRCWQASVIFLNILLAMSSFWGMGCFRIMILLHRPCSKTEPYSACSQ